MLALLIIFLAFLPSIVLFWYISTQDTYKEPMKTMIWVFIMGMVSAPFSTFFSGMMPDSINAGPFLSAAYTAFLQAAIPEELSKFIVLFAVVWNNRNFDEMFDGIVYASLVALGFAAFENLMYLLSYGTEVLLSRAFLAVPGHFFFGVTMGFFFGIGKFDVEHRKLCLALALLLPMLLHGLYDMLLMWAGNLDSWIYIVIMAVFYFFVYKLWTFGFKQIKALQGK